MVVRYDDDCGLCTRAMRWVMARASGVEFVALEEPGDSVEVRDAGVEWRGARAVAVLLGACGQPWRLIGRVLGWPVVRVAAEWVYRVVARNRARISAALGWEACAVRNPE